MFFKLRAPLIAIGGVLIQSTARVALERYYSHDEKNTKGTAPEVTPPKESQNPPLQDSHPRFSC